MSARLSYSFLPRAKPICTFTRLFSSKYMRVATMAQPCVCTLEAR